METEREKDGKRVNDGNREKIRKKIKMERKTEKHGKRK